MTSEAPRPTALEVRANRFDLVSRLAEDLAHEIKNPLHAMVINLELVKRRAAAGDADAAVQRAEIVGSEITRVNELLEILFGLLRPGRHSGPVADVAAVVDGLLPLLALQARLSKVQMGYHPPDQLLSSPIRRDALGQVVLNLVANALDAVRGSEDARFDLFVVPEAEGVRIRVSDTGPGIEPAALADLGSPGAAPRAGHAGLGLAVTRVLLEEAGGRLEIEESGGSGGGSIVAAWLPRGAA